MASFPRVRRVYHFGEAVTEHRDKTSQPAREMASRDRRKDKAEQKARQDALGAGLRHAYERVVNEPVPEEFRSLLDKLSRPNPNAPKP